MLNVQFGFTEFPDHPRLNERSPLSPGYIVVSQHGEDGLEVAARYDMMWLVMDLPELMSGLQGFVGNSRTKYYSFAATEAGCHIQIDRRKHSMVLLQVNEMQGLHSESEVFQAFQEGVMRFMKEEYSLVDFKRLEKESPLSTERVLDAEFRQCYWDFTASRHPA